MVGFFNLKILIEIVSHLLEKELVVGTEASVEKTEFKFAKVPAP